MRGAKANRRHKPDIRKASTTAWPCAREAQQLPRYSPNTACPKGSSKHIRFNHRGCFAISEGDFFENCFSKNGSAPILSRPDKGPLSSPPLPSLPISRGRTQVCALTCMTLRSLYAFNAFVLSFCTKEHIRNGI